MTEQLLNSKTHRNISRTCSILIRSVGLRGRLFEIEYQFIGLEPGAFLRKKRNWLAIRVGTCNIGSTIPENTIIPVAAYEYLSRPRLIEEKLLELFRYYPVIAVLGARQVGKSTLVQHLFGEKVASVVFDPVVDVGNARQDPEFFFTKQPAVRFPG